MQTERRSMKGTRFNSKFIPLPRPLPSSTDAPMSYLVPRAWSPRRVLVVGRTDSRSASAGRLFRDVHGAQGLLVRQDEVEDGDDRLVGAVDQGLRTRLEEGVADERRDGGHEAEGRAVHRL